MDPAAVIATGRRCPAIAAGKSEEETDKRIGAVLRDAVPVVSINTVNGDLGGDMLCQLVWAPLEVAARLSIQATCIGRANACAYAISTMAPPTSVVAIVMRSVQVIVRFRSVRDCPRGVTRSYAQDFGLDAYCRISGMSGNFGEQTRFSGLSDEVHRKRRGFSKLRHRTARTFFTNQDMMKVARWLI
ncbi:hypothetical protein G3T14_04555 [Methylobacterium sp. BTF04]|uniref:hypothetical protein n=1 Tax=Methylobacterium sp. BTF04 TaxID=2708300 RepID=UPI0013D6E365|nr:hypothetical protein [Methylobacterium sp. BTF04]NEU11397.1 hypothetical protein [Methylobacterium sp. BTF04]